MRIDIEEIINTEFVPWACQLLELGKKRDSKKLIDQYIQDNDNSVYMTATNIKVTCLENICIQQDSQSVC